MNAHPATACVLFVRVRGGYSGRGKTKHLGTFDTQLEAAAAYRDAYMEHRGSLPSRLDKAPQRYAHVDMCVCCGCAVSGYF